MNGGHKLLYISTNIEVPQCYLFLCKKAVMHIAQYGFHGSLDCFGVKISKSGMLFKIPNKDMNQK